MNKYILLCLLLSSFSLHAAVSNWVPFINDSGKIMLPVKIDGIDAQVGLDTGGFSNAIDQSFLDKHGQHFLRSKTAIIRGVNSEEKKNLVQNVPIELFGVSLELDDVVPLALNDWDLLLGAEFFRNFIFQIDYPNSRIRILTRDAIKLKKYANVKTSKAAGTGFPVVQVIVNNKDKIWLLFDTGNTGGILVPRFIAEEKDWLKNANTIDTKIRGANSVSNMDTFNLDKLKIGPFELENPIISIPKSGDVYVGGEINQTTFGSKISRGKKSRGILGYDILKHFVVTIDYKNYLINLSIPK